MLQIFINIEPIFLSMSEEDILSQRKEKLNGLKKNNIEPYPYKFSKKNSAASLVDCYKDLNNEEKTKDVVSIAGRIKRMRVMGKALFADLQDQTGKIQLYIKSDDVGNEAYELFTSLFDLGDIIGVKGTIFKT